MIQTEHLGEMDYREVDGRVEPTGYAEQSYLWTRNNDLLIEAAKQAVDRYGHLGPGAGRQSRRLAASLVGCGRTGASRHGLLQLRGLALLQSPDSVWGGSWGTTGALPPLSSVGVKTCS